MSSTAMSIRVGIDVGGTFTDGVIHRGDGMVLTAKSATTPNDPAVGLQATLAKLGVRPVEADILVHGTTLVTNLLLQQAGCRVGLLTTRGFRDVLEIQLSYRRDAYDLQWEKPEPLVPREHRLEVDERTTADGAIEVAPRKEEVAAAAHELVAAGCEALAICFLNSHTNNANEQRVEEWIQELFPDIIVSRSSWVDPQVREYERFSTTVINAYAVPATRSYLRRLEEEVHPDIFLMHSGGGLLPAHAVADRPVKLVMSGPAGGVVAALALGEQLREHNVITFDMGGTSTDVCVIRDGVVDRAEETELTWGIPLRAESIAVESIGAGGGSIASRDAGGALVVGPRSAGAHPGPACYGHGGSEVTVTDANLVLGLLSAERFLDGEMSLDFPAAEEVVTALADKFGVSVTEMAVGIHKVANARMAGLIREMTVNKGRDPREYGLVSFGGAGGQHAYGVAEIVGCSRVLFPRHSSVFSALGLVSSARQTTEAQAFLVPLADLKHDQLATAFERLEGRITRAARFIVEGDDVRFIRQVSVRYVGQTHEVRLPAELADDGVSVYERFQSRHFDLYGTRLDDDAEAVAIHSTVVATESPEIGGNNGRPQFPPPRVEPAREAVVLERRQVALFDQDLDVYDAASLTEGSLVEGPVLIEGFDTTITVPPGAAITAIGPEGTLRLDLA